jgi:thioesterase domain-containing protein
MVLADAGRPAAAGETGEILIRGPNVMRGYEDDPESNGRSFVDGWFRTGDLGWLDPEGYLFITGRVRELINRGGQKVSPHEVEEVLLRHPEVSDAAVFPMPDPRLSENVAAIVVLRDGATATERSLRVFAAAALADSKVPARIRFVAEIPKGAGGKVARLELARRFGPELAATARSAPSGRMSPVTELENRLAGIWRAVLGVPEVGLHDNFFDLGGDSFAAALLLTQVQERFELAAGELERIDFLDAPTVAGMARVLGDCSAREKGQPVEANRMPVVALQPRGRKPPFFCVPSLGGNPFYLIPLARRLGPEQPFYVLTETALPERRGSDSLGDIAQRYVDAMRELCPNGPYLLGGHCIGGIFAFEAARRLRAAGADVLLLALLDTPAPGYPHPLRHWRLFLRGTLYHAAGVARGSARLPGSFEELRALGRHLRRFAQATLERPAGPGNGAAPFSRGAGLIEANVKAARHYSPGSYPGRVVHIMAKSHPRTGSPLDRRMGWRELAEPGVEEFWVEGGHTSMMETPYVDSTAVQLSALLGRA